MKQVKSNFEDDEPCIELIKRFIQDVFTSSDTNDVSKCLQYTFILILWVYSSSMMDLNKLIEEISEKNVKPSSSKR